MVEATYGVSRIRSLWLRTPDTTSAMSWDWFWLAQPFKLDAVSLALQQVPGFGGMTVAECRGYGAGKLGKIRDPAGEPGAPMPRDAGLVDYTAKLRVDVAVAGRATAERVVEVIAQAAHTGRRGDGKVFLWPLTRAVRIRTLEQGPVAL